ncbi:limbic system-associated membrane protein-like [Choristoneura fumiferana]|uniref:limbic system-associated membrane protein-like n=1 Tax=Choristoneura fumiferana TaxID=7141 RepID=UPI003D15514B
MELRRVSVCLAFLLVAVVSQCSEARHSRQRRDTNYDDAFLSDGALDTEQNDADNQADIDGDSMPILNATITSRPQTYNLTIGRSVRLECRVDIKDTVVEWTKDGQTIVKTDFLVGSPTKYDFNSTASSDLIVKSVEPSDSGIYRCRLEQGLPAQVEHSLVVYEAPIVVNITASPSDRPREGADVTLTCNVNGSPAPEVQWTLTPLGSTENKNLGEKDATFTRYGVTIKNIKSEQSGTYFCYAFNSVGNNQNMIKVVVLGKPRIHVHQTVVNSAINVEATLRCVVHEDLPVAITWFKDQKPITSASKTRISTMGTHSNLTVIPESDADFGTYTCEASCDIGVHSRSIELVQRPVVEDLEADGSKLAFKVHSHQKLEDIEVLIKPLTEEGDWMPPLKVTLPPTQSHEYDVSYVIQQELTPGRYEAIVKVKNNKEWSHPSDAAIVNIVNEQPVIQGASVYRGNDATLNRPATVLLSTVLMYLLVRML